MSSIRMIVIMHLVGYSSISVQLEQGDDVTAVAKLNEKIQQFVDAGLIAARLQRSEAVPATARILAARPHTQLKTQLSVAWRVRAPGSINYLLGVRKDVTRTSGWLD